MYYKVLTKDMCSPYDGKTTWAVGEVTELNNDRPLDLCWNGLHLYKSLRKISIGEFGPRVFEAEPIGELVNGRGKVCCRRVKLIKEIDPSEVIDEYWIYEYCDTENDIPEVRKNITSSIMSLDYCLYIKDRPSVRKHITDSRWAYDYCVNVKDRPSVRANITYSWWALMYCINIKDRQSVRKHITDSRDALSYCCKVKDRLSVCKHITDTDIAKRYCKNVKDRPCVRKYIKE